MTLSTPIRHQSVVRLSGRVRDDERRRLCVLRASGTGYMTGFVLFNHLLLVCCRASLPVLERNRIVANSLEGELRSQAVWEGGFKPEAQFER